MAITIQAQLAKKLPIAGTDFSSQQASITITAEVTDLSQVVAEAQRLYHLAEQAVDQQLHQGQAVPAPTPVQPPGRSAPGHQPRAASQPYRSSRRGPAPVTDSQLRFIQRLIDQAQLPVADICAQHQVSALAQLSCRDAAALIDELKSQVPV